MAHHRPHTPIALLMALLATLLLGTIDSKAQSREDMELLGKVHFDAPQGEREVPYGIEPGRRSLSPLYHAASGVLWFWENHVAPEVCAPGGYADTNTAYFKALVVEYGAPMAIVYGLDRMARNTKVGRASTPTNSRGLIEDNPKRYRR